ncbi:KEX2-like protein [Mya arenaria]|uniref:KEX2-like protein n=1 Tax=Mya arenaria TaxID=6604 RepID=A0ABY7G6R3_MYAAR|nr:KEX2-like protein [Mya arenaria]
MILTINLFCVLVPYVFAINESLRFSNTWLLQGPITEDEVKRVSFRLGFNFVKKLPTNHFVLTRGDVPHRSRRRYNYNNSLRKALNLTFIKQEEWINVSLRQIMDPKWPQMWYLNSRSGPSMGVEDTWKMNLTGKGVTLAIVDDGVDYNNPDLKDRILRGGKGVIYVFAGGNGGFDDNCNMDGYVNSIYTIGINGVARDLEPPGYAEPCSAVLASAYTGKGGTSDNLCTTDVNGGCINSFTGTSAAAPLAAGALALVLEAKGIKPKDTVRVVNSQIYTDGCNDTTYCVNRVEHVEAYIEFSYTTRGVIELSLESPSGTILLTIKLL